MLPDNICEAFEKGYIDEDDLLYEISTWYTDEGSIEDNCESIFIGSTYIDFDGCTKGLYDYLTYNLSIELVNYGERILSEHADDNSGNHIEEYDAEDDSESKEYEHGSRLEGLLDYDDDTTFGFINSGKKESIGHIIVNNSTKIEESKDADAEPESEIESEIREEDTIDADKEYDINNPSSFIVRNREKERSLGIKDIKIHCN